MIKIGIFASGSGTNAEKIIDYFSKSSDARVALLVSDNPNAFALERASRQGVPTAVFTRDEFADGSRILELLQKSGINYIVLAGFLRLVPYNIIEAFPGRIVNIHPALLPKYGGKGMYGDRVHKAVIEAGEKESGITIHKVNEHYDDGAVIAQYRVEVTQDDTPDTLAQKIHALEHRYFPEVIEQDILKLRSNSTEIETALIKGNSQRIEAFREILSARHLNDHTRDIVKLLIDDNFNKTTFKGVLDRYGIKNVKDIKQDTTLLLVYYAGQLFSYNEISDNAKYSFEMLKLYFKIREGDFYKFRKPEIEALLHTQFEKLYSDNKITKEESLFAFEMQDMFDLSYRQFEGMKEREVALALARGADPLELDAFIDHNKLKNF